MEESTTGAKDGWYDQAIKAEEAHGRIQGARGNLMRALQSWNPRAGGNNTSNNNNNRFVPNYNRNQNQNQNQSNFSTQTNHFSGHMISAPRPPQNNPSSISRVGKQCYNCGKMGHFARDCRSPKANIRNMNFEEQQNYGWSNNDEMHIRQINNQRMPLRDITNEQGNHYQDNSNQPDAVYVASLLRNMDPNQHIALIDEMEKDFQ